MGAPVKNNIRVDGNLSLRKKQLDSEAVKLNHSAIDRKNLSSREEVNDIKVRYIYKQYATVAIFGVQRYLKYHIAIIKRFSNNPVLPQTIISIS